MATEQCSQKKHWTSVLLHPKKHARRQAAMQAEAIEQAAIQAKAIEILEEEKENLRNVADALQHMVNTKQQELTDLEAKYKDSVMEKINAAKQAIAAEKAKAVQASESQQAQLRITELETQEKVHATSIKDLQTRLATADGMVVKLQEEVSKSREAMQQVPTMAVTHHRKPTLAAAASSLDGRDTPLPAEATRQDTVFYKAVQHDIQASALPDVHTIHKLKGSLGMHKPCGVYFNIFTANWDEAVSAVDLPEIEVVLLTDATVVFDLDLTGDKSIGINQEELSAYSVQQGWDPAKVLPCVLDVGAMDFAMPIGKYRGSKRGKLRCKTLDKNGTELDQALRAFQHKVLACCPNAKLVYENFDLLRPSEALHQSSVLSQKEASSGSSGGSNSGASSASGAAAIKSMFGPPTDPFSSLFGAAMLGDTKNGSSKGLSSRSLQMLSKHCTPDGQLLPQLKQLDPELINRVLNDVVEDCQGIGWDSIVGLEDVKQLIQYNMVLPMYYPHLFKGIRAPAKGMLLFGPPGTGKTMLGRAVASNVQATFFSISASSLTSKFVGDSEMLVRTLFTLARCMQPSVIFIDEVDALLSSRHSDGVSDAGGHDATRKMKNELLVQMEGCTTGDQHVMLIGATNVPQELDDAARRRMPKQVFVPLPCCAARNQMLRVLDSDPDVRTQMSEDEWDCIVSKTEGYSGSDMRNLMQEAASFAVREATKDALRSAEPLAVSPQDIRPVNLDDFQKALKAAKAASNKDSLELLQKYDREFGAQYQ